MCRPPNVECSRCHREKHLEQLRKRLISMATSEFTVITMQAASPRDLRGFEKEMAHISFNGTIMEWASELLIYAVRHRQMPCAANPYQWKQALLFVHAILKNKGRENPSEEWMRRKEDVLRPFFIRCYEAIVQETLAALFLRPMDVFFDGMLHFAAHFAKHAVPIRWRPAHYLRKARALLELAAEEQKDARVHRLRGWHLYVSRRDNFPYIKSLHWKTPNKY